MTWKEKMIDWRKRRMEMYGLYMTGRFSYEDIGKKYGITSERVRAIIHYVAKRHEYETINQQPRQGQTS